MNMEIELLDEDLIKRSDAIEAIKKHHFFINNQCTYPSEGCIEVIEDAINVPPANRPQGEWIEMYRNGFGNMICMCSKCSFHTSKSRYCPNCGARMKGLEKEVKR